MRMKPPRDNYATHPAGRQVFSGHFIVTYIDLRAYFTYCSFRVRCCRHYLVILSSPNEEGWCSESCKDATVHWRTCILCGIEGDKLAPERQINKGTETWIKNFAKELTYLAYEICFNMNYTYTRLYWCLWISSNTINLSVSHREGQYIVYIYVA